MAEVTDNAVAQFLAQRACDVPGIAGSHVSVLRKLTHILPRNMTLRQVLQVSEQQFSEIPAVGATFLARFRALQQDLTERLRGLTEGSGGAVSFAEQVIVGAPEASSPLEKIRREKLARYALHAGHLEPRVARELVALVERSAQPLRLLHLVELDPRRLQLLAGIGPKRYEALCDLRWAAEQAAQELLGERELAPGEVARVVRIEGPRWPVDVLDQCLAEDLIAYVERLPENLQRIVAGVLGIGQPARTQTVIAEELSVSRQRISQIFQSATALIVHYLRAHPERTWDELSAMRGRDLYTALPRLAGVLGGQDAFYIALSLLCNQPLKTVIESLREPGERYLDIHQFADVHACSIGPVHKLEHVFHITQVMDLDVAEAEAYVDRFIERGDLEPVDGGLFPRALQPKVAVARVLYEQLGSLSVDEIIAAVNSSGTVRTPISSTQFGRYVEHNRWVYLAGRGRFRHVARLALDDEAIDHVLDQVHLALKASGHVARNLTFLYPTLEIDERFDYYAVRHIVRDHGERRGLSFVGRSRVDTVSFEDLENGKRVADEILSYMRATRTPVRRADLVQRWPLISEPAMFNHLKYLERTGHVARIGRGEFALLEDVSARFDLDALREGIRSVVARTPKPVHLTRLQVLLQEVLGIEVPSGLLSHVLERGATEGLWFSVANIVSREPLSFRSIKELMQDVTGAVGRERDAMAAELARRLDVTPDRVSTWIWVTLQGR